MRTLTSVTADAPTSLLRRSVLLPVASTALAVVLVLTHASPAAAATATVRAKSGDAWAPVQITVDKGDRVVWKNPTAKVHDVKSMGSNWAISSVLDPGEQVGRTFYRAGTYRFRCVRHSAIADGSCHGMCGAVRVVKV